MPVSNKMQSASASIVGGGSGSSSSSSVSRPIHPLPARPPLPSIGSWLAPSPPPSAGADPNVGTGLVARPVLTHAHAAAAESSSSSSSTRGVGRPRKTSLSFRKMLSKDDLRGFGRKSAAATSTSRPSESPSDDGEFVIVSSHNLPPPPTPARVSAAPRYHSGAQTVSSSSSSTLVSTTAAAAVSSSSRASVAAAGGGHEEISSRLAKIGWDDDHITGGGVFMDDLSEVMAAGGDRVKIPLGQSRSLRTGLVMDDNNSSPDSIRIGKRSKPAAMNNGSSQESSATITTPGRPFASSAYHASSSSSPFKFGSFSPSDSPPPDTPIKSFGYGSGLGPIRQPAFSPVHYHASTAAAAMSGKTLGSGGGSLFSSSKPLRNDASSTIASSSDVLGSRPLRDRTNHVLRKSAPHLAGHLTKELDQRRPSLPHHALGATTTTKTDGGHRRAGSNDSTTSTAVAAGLLSRSRGLKSGLSQHSDLDAATLTSTSSSSAFSRRSDRYQHNHHQDTSTDATASQHAANSSISSSGCSSLLPKSLSTSSRSSFESTGSLLTPEEEAAIMADVMPSQAAFKAAEEGQVVNKFQKRRASNAALTVGQSPMLAAAIHAPQVSSLITSTNGALPASASTSLATATKQPPPSVMKAIRPAILKRASSCGAAEAAAATQPGLSPHADWQAAFMMSRPLSKAVGSLVMPDTPVKRSSLGHAKAHSHGSHPHPKLSIPIEPVPVLHRDVSSSSSTPSVTATTSLDLLLGDAPPSSSSGFENSSSSPVDSMQASPTVRMSDAKRTTESVRKGLLRRLSSGGGQSDPSDQEGTPTKAGSAQRMLGATPTPSPRSHSSVEANSQRGHELRTVTTPVKQQQYHLLHSHNLPSASPLVAPRHSLPHFALSSSNNPPRTSLTSGLHHHRQSAPLAIQMEEEEDVFDSRFVVLETLGKGAFSQVFKVKERDGEGVYAVKRAKGMFEGNKDRLRHLEEVDILRHLSRPAHPNVITFIDAWEQSRQLFIQTELCLGSLAFFLEEYGSVVERLDEARAWKIARELADGLYHIHSMGVIHFDIKPANVLITDKGSLKIGDFGMATRWPRVDAASIIRGSGMGGEAGSTGIRPITDREGDRDYMAPEMLDGRYTMAADIFSFGLCVLEASTNIVIPQGGAAWHALRENDFGVVDFANLSAALTDLITRCMRAEPIERPSIIEIVNHPIICRARELGHEALTPEDDLWLAHVLTGSERAGQEEVDEDVEMA